MDKMIKSKTLLNDNEFLWNFRAESGLIIEKKLKDSNLKLEFKTDEIEKIMGFIDSKDSVFLGANKEITIEIDPQTLSSFIFNVMRKKITEAEAAKEIVSILNEAELLNSNKEDQDLLLTINQSNWKIDWKGKVRKLYINKSL